MTEPRESHAPAPTDARRAAFRARDAIRAARVRSGVAPDEGVEVSLVDPEVALPVDGVARAIVEAARDGASCLAPGGGWSGGPFTEVVPYVASWELEHLARERASAPAERRPAAGPAPATVSGRATAGAPAAFSPWLVHSFAGRKGHARPDVAALVPAFARSVLDVGCGEGALGASLAARGARVTGIEHDPAAAAVAQRRLARVLACGAGEAAGLLSERPDVVLLADVLEHLDDPAGVLRALRGAVAPGGLLVFSLPNATHAAVLGGALRGRWDRELEGIVADDHRTYAGRAGWTALLSACGFRVTALRAVPAPTPLSDPDRSALLAASGLTPDDLDAVQWLGTAEPAAPGGDDVVQGTAGEDGPLSGEDPVGAVAARLAEGAITVPVRNPAHAGLVEALLGGGLVAGRDASGLLSGWTIGGLARRFEGSGLRVRIEASDVAPLPAAVRSVVAAYREAGLAVDEEALAAETLRATFDAGR